MSGPQQPSEPRAPRAGRARTWLLAGGALAAVVLVSIIAVTQNSEDRVDDETGDVTAWQNRIQMEAVMRETAELVGVAVVASEVDDQPLGCDLDGARDGLSFLVSGYEGPAVEDLDAALAQVRAMWEDKGWVVNDRAIGVARGLSTTMPDGGIFSMLPSPYLTIFAGESGCARTIGTSVDPSTPSATDPSTPAPTTE